MTLKTDQIDLEQLALTFSCDEDWDAMTVTGGCTRHCDACQEEITDLSAMTREEVAQSLSSGELGCISFEIDHQGRLIVSPPPQSRVSGAQRTQRALMTASLSLSLAACQPAHSDPAPSPSGQANTPAQTSAQGAPPKAPSSADKATDKATNTATATDTDTQTNAGTKTSTDTNTGTEAETATDTTEACPPETAPKTTEQKSASSGERDAGAPAPTGVVERRRNIKAIKRTSGRRSRSHR